LRHGAALQGQLRSTPGQTRIARFARQLQLNGERRAELAALLGDFGRH
jgi:hypothetical protein